MALEFKDRVPQKPGRVKITPENGTAFYATMERADEPIQEGTPLSAGNFNQMVSMIQNTYTKAETLSDATKPAYGLGANAVPEDVFAYLGQYNQHWWERHTYTPETYGTVDAPNTYALSAGSVSYADSFTVNPDGTLVLNNPTSVLVTTLYDNRNSGKYDNKYWSGFSYSETTSVSRGTFDGVIYIESTSLFAKGSQGYYCIKSTECVFYKGTGRVVHDAFDFVYSTDLNAYPDYAYAGNYYYVYTGIPFNNAVGAPKMAYGSYKGTGKAGADNPTVLTFEFVPKIVFISAKSGVRFSHDDGYNQNYAMLIKGVTSAYVQQASSNVSNTQLAISWVGTSVSMYHTYSTPYAASQFNSSGTTYYYLALG